MSARVSEVRVLKDQVAQHKSNVQYNNNSANNNEYINSQTKLKIALIGPCKAGKTKIANQIDGRPLLVDQTFLVPPESNPLQYYDPTAGVRILEFEENINGRSPDNSISALLTVMIELWDCSGDDKYESCKLAITDKLDGAIVIFDPTSKEQATEVRVWCEYFIKHSKLSDGQITIFAHGELTQQHKPLSIRVDNRTVMAPIINVTTKQVPEVDPQGNRFPLPAKLEFQNFVGALFGNIFPDQLEAFAQ